MLTPEMVEAAIAMARFLDSLYEPWMHDAPCRKGRNGAGTRSDDFFPAPNEAPNSLRERRARRVCVSCPKRRLCLEEAFKSKHSVDNGIWGGTSPRERKAVQHLPPPERYEALELWLRAHTRGPFAVADPIEWRSHGEEREPVSEFLADVGDGGRAAAAI